MKIIFANRHRASIAAYHMFYALIGVAFGVFAFPLALQRIEEKPGLGFNIESLLLVTGILLLLSFVLHCIRVVIWGGLGLDMIEITSKDVILRRKYRHQKWQLRPIILRARISDVKTFSLREELDNIFIPQTYRFPQAEGYNIQVEFESSQGGAFGFGLDAVFGKKMPKDRALKKIEQLNNYLKNIKKGS